MVTRTRCNVLLYVRSLVIFNGCKQENGFILQVFYAVELKIGDPVSLHIMLG